MGMAEPEFDATHIAEFSHNTHKADISNLPPDREDAKACCATKAVSDRPSGQSSLAATSDQL